MPVKQTILVAEEFRTLAENSPDVIDRFDCEFHHVYVNAAGLRLHNLPADKVIGKTIRETGLSEPFCSRWEERIRQVFKTAEPLDVEDFFPSSEGIRYFESRCAPELDPAGSVRYVLVLTRDITERKRTEDALQKSHRELERRVRERTARLQALTGALTQAEQRERRRIAEILHEDVQQQLVGMRYRIGMLKQREKDGPSARDADWLLEQLARTIELTSRLTTRLRPPVLYELGLKAALDWLAADVKERTGLNVVISGREPLGLESPDLRAFACGAVSELLLNVVKHADVHSATVRIRSRGKTRITIEVSDNGKGFDTSVHPQHTHFGLFSIRERAEALGGRMDVTSQPGGGTCVALTLPGKPA